MKKITLISWSLREKSLSNILLKYSEKILIDKWFETNIIDLRNENIPFCDWRSLEEYWGNIKKIYKSIEDSNYIIFWMPVYCYSVSWPLKNFIDIFSKAFSNKYFGICSSAWSKMSYLASADLIKILSFESKATWIQPIVLADNNDFDDIEIKNDEIKKRISNMIEILILKE